MTTPSTPPPPATQFVERLLQAKNRDAAAAVYVEAFWLFDAHDADTWQVIHRAILKRWTMNGLCYIKEHAWKIVQDK